MLEPRKVGAPNYSGKLRDPIIDLISYILSITFTNDNNHNEWIILSIISTTHVGSRVVLI